MNRAVNSCQRLLIMIEEIKHSRNLPAANLYALEKDELEIRSLLEVIKNANTKAEMREAWMIVDQLKHTFGGSIGGDEGDKLSQLFEQLWQDILSLL